MYQDLSVFDISGLIFSIERVAINVSPGTDIVTPTVSAFISLPILRTTQNGNALPLVWDSCHNDVEGLPTRYPYIIYIYSNTYQRSSLLGIVYQISHDS